MHQELTCICRDMCSCTETERLQCPQVHEVDAPNTTASFRQFHVDQIAADIKESICRVSDNPFDAQENFNIPTVSYEVNICLTPDVAGYRQTVPA